MSITQHVECREPSGNFTLYGEWSRDTVYSHTVCQQIRLVPWMSCTVVSLLQWNLARDISVALAIKRIHNLPPHLSCVSTLPEITQKPKIYIVFVSVVRVALKRTGFGVQVALKRAVFATAQWLRRWCPEEYTVPNMSMLQLVSVAFQFLCNVR